MHEIDGEWRARNGARCRECWQATQGRYDRTDKGKARRRRYADAQVEQGLCANGCGEPLWALVFANTINDKQPTRRQRGEYLAQDTMHDHWKVERSEMGYKLSEPKPEPDPRIAALIAPAKAEHRMGKELAQAVIDGEMTAEEAGAVLLAREVRKIT